MTARTFHSILAARRLRALALGVALVSLGGPAAVAAGMVGCEIRGYSKDPDPRGANLRAAPGTGAAIVRRLPPPVRDGEEMVAAEFDVVGSQDGWLLIRNVTQGGYGGLEPRRVFAGPAWISAGLVGFGINGMVLRSAPSPAASVVARLSGQTQQGEGWGPDSVTLERVHGCQGSFADVRVSLPDGRRLRGWATGICSNQVTTCP